MSSVITGNENGIGKAVIRDSFSLCTWNVNKKCGTSRWGELFPRFHSLYAPDFYLFQEMDYHPERCELFHDKGFASAFLPNLKIFYRDKTHSGVATLSRFCAEEHVPFLTEHREPLLNTPKATLASSFPVEGGKTLLVVNIHGINFVRSHKFAHQIDTMKKHLTLHDGPVIIAGDFNTWNETRVKHVESLLEHLPNLQLKHVEFEDNHQDVKHAPALLHHFFGAHPLDRIYYSSRDLEVIDTPEVPLSIDDEALDVSDHMPLVVRFALRNGSTQ